MSAARAPGGDLRHPWLAKLVQAPVIEFTRLIERTADIHPYERADPADAAWLIAGHLSKDDPAHQAFDTAALEYLQQQRRAPPQTTGQDQLETYIGDCIEAFRVVRRLGLVSTCADVRSKYIAWNAWADPLVLDDACDLRSEFLLTVALAQRNATDPGSQVERLAGLWMDICENSGGKGRYPDHYLSIGLRGLRGLPGRDEAAPEMLSMMALAKWSIAQRPSRRDFLREWRAVKGLYPRAPSHWRRVLSSILVSKGLEEDFEAAQWWKEECGLGQTGTKPFIPEPDLQEVHNILDMLRSEDFGKVRSSIRSMVAIRKRYAQKTGDSHYLSKSACWVGRKVLENAKADLPARGEIGVELAEDVLGFENDNIFAWNLWSDALSATGAIHAAELIGWEALRRFPDDAARYSQLALILEKQPQRVADAEALLRMARERFPQNAYPRHQLADFLYTDNRPDEAEELLAEAVEAGIVNEITYRQLVRLAVAKGNIGQAQTHVVEGLRRWPADPFLERLKRQLHAHEYNVIKDVRSIPLRSDPAAEDRAMRRELVGAAIINGRIRRDAFWIGNDTRKSDAVEDLKQIYVDGTQIPYAELVLSRAQDRRPNAEAHPSSLAFALEVALRDRASAQLPALASRDNRLFATTLRVLEGDRTSAVALARYLREEPQSARGAPRALHNLLLEGLVKSDEPDGMLDEIIAGRDRVERYMRDAADSEFTYALAA